MATMVLYAAGFTFAPGIGGWITAALFAYADQKILQKLFGQDVPKPRIGDITLQTAEEGAPITMLFGEEVRVGGEVMWNGPIQVVESDQSGCCGGPSAPPSYGYFGDVAIAIGQPPPGAVCEAVEKIWADGKVVFEDSPDVSASSASLTASVYERVNNTAIVLWATNTNPVQMVLDRPFGTFLARIRIAGCIGNTSPNGLWQLTPDAFNLTVPVAGNGTYTGGGTASLVELQPQINSPNGGPDLSLFRAGHDVLVSGFTGGAVANNGTWECIESFMDSATGISYVRLDNPAAVAAVAGPTITLFQDLPQHSGRHFTSFVFHNGSQWQPPDSLIEATEGAGNVSGNPGIIYGVFERFNRTMFGDRIPNMNWLCRVTTGWTVGQCIAAILQRYSFDASEYDVSTLTLPCRGYSVRGPVTGKSCLAAIMLTFDVTHYEEDGRLVFVRRKDLVAEVISAAELAAHEPGSDCPRNSQVTQVRDRELPREIQIHYSNPAKDYQGGMEPARRWDATGDIVESIETNVTMTPGSAQDMAKRILWTGIANRDRLQIRLPPSRMRIREGMLLRYTDVGRTWNLLSDKVQFTNNGHLIVDGPNDEVAALDFSGSPADGGADDNGGPGILEAQDLQVIDIAPLNDAQVQSPGVYVAVAPRAPDRIWVAGSLWESAEVTDGTFTQTMPLNTPSRMGRSLTVLGTGVSPYMIDYKNTVDVFLSYGVTLESVSEILMLRGKNRAILGEEMIGFTTATLIATNTWRLSGILRGLRDTDTMLASHRINERFIFIAGGVEFVPQGISMLGSDRFFRAVVNGGVVDDYPTVAETYDANTVRPFSVFDVRATRDASDATPDVVVAWTRQTRANVAIFQPNPIPVLESSERYEVDLLTSGTISVALTKAVTSPTATWLTAEVTGAGYAAAAPITVRVYQMGDLVGRGRVRLATV